MKNVKSRRISKTLLLSIILVIACAAIALSSCSIVKEIEKRKDAKEMRPPFEYTLESSHAVDGRQGVAVWDGRYYVSGSTTLSIYDKDWNLVKTNDDPFADAFGEANHIGDIEVYKGRIYAAVEYFMDGVSSNVQVLEYDAETLESEGGFSCSDGMPGEISGLAIDPDSRSLWLCSWANDDSGCYLYRYGYRADEGEYYGRVRMVPAPAKIQGIAYLDGYLYISSDDGDADKDEPDHIYRCRVDSSIFVLPQDPDMADKTKDIMFDVTEELTLDDVTRQGEIEGLSFDRENKQLLVCYNRGAVIVDGMPKGFYEGYDEEIHEVFVYDASGMDTEE